LFSQAGGIRKEKSVGKGLVCESKVEEIDEAVL